MLLRTYIITGSKNGIKLEKQMSPFTTKPGQRRKFKFGARSLERNQLFF